MEIEFKRFQVKKPIDKVVKSQNIIFLSTFWWLLWISAIVLLEFYYRDLSGDRIKILHGQYWFFIIAQLSILGLLIDQNKRLMESFYTNKSLILGFGLLFFAQSLSAIFGINAVYGLRLLAILISTSLPFILLGITSHFMTVKSRLAPQLFVSLACALGACILEATGPIYLADVIIENYLMPPRQRWAFMFTEANALGGMMALGIVVALFQMRVSKSWVITWGLGVLILPIISFVFWETNARGALLWILVTLLFYGGLTVRNLLVKLEGFDIHIYFLPLGFVFGLLLLVLIFFRQEIADFLRLNQADFTTGRMEIWLMYLEKFKSHPLLGFGFGASNQLMADFDVKGPYPISGPLNIFIGILGETGLLGFVAMIWLWCGATLRAWRIVKSQLFHQEGDFHYAFFLMVTLISLAAHQNGEWQVMRITPFNFLFFFLVSAAWTLPERTKTQPCKM